jgi:magnesium transporter
MEASSEVKNRDGSRMITYEKLEEQVCNALEADDTEGLQIVLSESHPANIATVIDRVEEPWRIRIFEQLAGLKAIRVLDELSSEATRQILEKLPNEEIGSLLDRMPMDDVAEILLEDVPERQEELLAMMSPADAQEVRDLLRFPKESIGHMMTERFIRLHPGMTVAETLVLLRQVDPEVEYMADLYVLNAHDLLIGFVSLRDVVTSVPERRVDEMMVTDLITVTPEMDQEEVARLVSHYDILAVPVVTQKGQMLGIVPVDDVIDVLVSETTEDILRFGGMEAGAIDQPYFSVSIPTAVRKRIGWLLLLFLAETLTGTVLRLFESELAQVVALSFFIPLLIGTGGNTGSQTVSTIIRGLALGEVQWHDIWRVIRREIFSGLLLGTLLGLVAFGRTLLWGSGMDIALVVALTVLVICVWANTIGSLIPMFAYKLKVDPAVVSAPLITTLVDATGLAIYLLIAKMILGLS